MDNASFPDFTSLYRKGHGSGRVSDLAADKKVLADRRTQVSAELNRNSLKHYWKHLVALPRKTALFRNFTADCVCIGDKTELTQPEKDTLYKALKSLQPWRKGPFTYFGLNIDSEWRSHLKWDRIITYLAPDLKGKVIADVGCNNMYYMFRMLQYEPKFILGFDPLARYYFHYLLNKRFIPMDKMHFELFGAEDLSLFSDAFDVVFFMGIIYHRRNPMDSLERVLTSLKPGGSLIMESAGIPGSDAYCLFPEDRYMKSKGYWFLPTWKALENMLKRAGFVNVKTAGVWDTTFKEQRGTNWINTESLEEFLDDSDNSLTVEGYPAPVRIYISAKKKKSDRY